MVISERSRLSGVMRLFGWEATLGYGSSGSDPEPLEPATGADMELTPEKKEAISQVSLTRMFVGLACDDMYFSANP